MKCQGVIEGGDFSEESYVYLQTLELGVKYVPTEGRGF